jgi:methylation protein EvaC|tara:strand:- start:309 stop:1484 length:1176 start_codon:yes stop_codon:yes gene_type:complete
VQHKLIEFKNIALSNDLLESKNDKPNLYDLKVVFDDETKLVQVVNNVNSEKMFNSTYVYDSSRSMTMLNHFEEAALSLQKRFKPELSLEIGSNSGIFIKHFPNDKSVAVEPCTNFSDLTNKMGIKTYGDFWNKSTQEKVVSENGRFSLIFSSNTVSHVQNLQETLQLIKESLLDDGVFVLETPSFLEVLKYNAFDQFYHEHQSYFSYISVKNIVEKLGMRIFDLEQYSVHGGTYRFFICKQDSSFENVIDNKIIEDEIMFGVDDYDKLCGVMDTIKHNITEIKRVIEEIKSNGHSVVGYGATAKFTNVMNMCGLNNNHIDYVLDTTPLKNNKWIPNTNVQIRAYEPSKVKDVDYFYLGAWNYKNEVINKELQFIRNGGKFITHIPEVTILT